MKIGHISDTHNKHNQVILPDLDMIIHTGDISSKGYEEEVKKFFKWFKSLPIRYKILICGNHDRTFEDAIQPDGVKPEWLIKELAEFQGDGQSNFYLENSGCEIEGIKIWGSPITPSFHRNYGWAWNRDRGDEIRQVWEQIPFGTDILLTHGPAYCKHDYNHQQAYVGCEDLLWHIKRVKPKIHLFGHIHECGGEKSYDENAIYCNGCACNLQYNVVNKPHIFEMDENKDINF